MRTLPHKWPGCVEMEEASLPTLLHPLSGPSSPGAGERERERGFAHRGPVPYTVLLGEEEKSFEWTITLIFLKENF